MGLRGRTSDQRLYMLSEAWVILIGWWTYRCTAVCGFSNNSMSHMINVGLHTLPIVHMCTYVVYNILKTGVCTLLYSSRGMVYTVYKSTLLLISNFNK